jgi:hypothetical protein
VEEVKVGAILFLHQSTQSALHLGVQVIHGPHLRHTG